MFKLLKPDRIIQRLGDKYLEIDRTLGPGLPVNRLKTYFSSATRLVNSILSTNQAPDTLPSLLDESSNAKEWTGKPSLVLMSDDPAVKGLFEASELAKAFRIFDTVSEEKNVAENEEISTRNISGTRRSSAVVLPSNTRSRSERQERQVAESSAAAAGFVSQSILTESSKIFLV